MTQVVVLSVQGESDYLRRAMLAGARDFLTKPPSGDELMGTIRQVYETGKKRAAVVTPTQQAARTAVATTAEALEQALAAAALVAARKIVSSPAMVPRPDNS